LGRRTSFDTIVKKKPTKSPARTGVELQASAVDSVPLGIAKADRQGAITYANREMLRISGLDDWRGHRIQDVFFGKNLRTVLGHLDARFQRPTGGQYEVDLTRQDGVKVPVSITAFPETDASGRVTTAVAIIRDLTIDKAERRMYQALQEETKSASMLHAIANELQVLIPYDRLTIIRLNDERTHLRTIFSCSRSGPEPEYAFRWWRVPRSVEPLLHNRSTLIINDLPRWYRHPSRISLLRDPAIKAHLKEGFRACLSYPITQHGVRAANVTLHRKKGKPFSDEDKRLIDALPIAEAVNLALRSETEGNLNFLIQLMKHISSAYESTAQVAQTIVDKIYDHYGWDYVSIFQVLERRREIKLIAQRARKPALLAAPHYTLKIDEGIVGHVFRTKEAVNIGHLSSSPQFRHIFVRRENMKTSSDLCVPIGKRAHWLLSIEDKRRNAFSRQEKKDLEAIAAELSALLDRSIEYRYRSAIFNRANDAIILTDDEGTIVEVNDATLSLLRRDSKTIAGRPISAFIKDDDLAASIMRGPAFANHEVVMRRTADDEVRVLLSAAALPSDIGGRVFVATDMTLATRVEQLELAQDLYREVTAQVKTPMSLAMAWLRRQSLRGNGSDLSTKIHQQLQKVELILDRMMLYERGESDDVRHDVLMQVDGLIQSVLLELPESERACISAELSDSGANVRGDAYELRYCLQTVLSYLLRLVPVDGRIELEVGSVDGIVNIGISGPASREVPNTDYSEAARRGQLMTEIALGRRTLETLVKRNHGHFEGDEQEAGERVQFRLSFPVATREAIK
jgi:PAS domain S-box-containing protein